KAQAEADEAMVQELEESAELPEGKKKVDYLYTEADGVFVRDVKKNKHIEVSHAISYEGWKKNGSRVSLVNPKVVMTTKDRKSTRLNSSHVSISYAVFCLKKKNKNKSKKSMRN